MIKDNLGFNIILLGQIASGKETQASMLMRKYNLKPVESGKYWRTMLKSKTKEGDLLRKTTGKGFPAPVSLMKKFIIDSLNKKPNNKNLIFIGNPRLKPEAQLLLKLLKERKEKVLALYISLPDREIYKRSVKRKSSNIKEFYKIFDEKKLIEKRIKWHKNQVSKTVNYLYGLKLLKKINGNQPIDKVFLDIERIITYFKNHENSF